MASEKVVQFTDSNFEAEVLKSDKPVLVDFWAEWCQPCRMLSPTIDQLAAEFDGKIKVGKVDTDNNLGTAVKYDIQAIPTVIVFKGGEPVKRFTGLQSKAEFTNAINAVLGG
jgi:thioredoxin 1